MGAIKIEVSNANARQGARLASHRGPGPGTAIAAAVSLLLAGPAYAQTAVGNGTVQNPAGGGIVISGTNCGQQAAVKGATDTGRLAVGCFSVSNGINSVAMGIGADTEAQNALALGTSATALGLSSFAAGTFANAASPYAVAIGYNSKATGQWALALGGGEARANNAGDVALGSGAVTSVAAPVASTVIRGTTYNFAGAAPTSVVSVGAVGAERQIQNVAAGRIGGASTDAINGSQLHATNQKVDLNTTDITNLGGRIPTGIYANVRFSTQLS